MRWFDSEKEGTLRLCEGFLWFPKKIENETRWLENTRWVQRCFRSVRGTLYWADWEWR